MSEPPRDPGDREGRREERPVQPDGVEHQRGVELDVRRQATLGVPLRQQRFGLALDDVDQLAPPPIEVFGGGLCFWDK